MLAADRDDLAGEVGRVVTGEEDDDAGDLPRLGRAPERLLAGQLGETPGQVLGKPLADAAPELLVLGADRTRASPATDPRARRGGCRPAGASCLASNWPPRVRSAYQALASLEATWWRCRSRLLSQAQRRSSATGRPTPSREARVSVTTSYFIRPRPSHGHLSPRA